MTERGRGCRILGGVEFSCLREDLSDAIGEAIKKTTSGRIGNVAAVDL